MSPRTTTVNYDEIQGNPFSSEEFSTGTIIFLTGFKKEVPMRYNWYEKEMEIYFEDKIYVISNTTDIDYVLVNGEKYIPFKHIKSINNYLIEKYKGTYSLFRQEDVRFVKGAPAQSGYDKPTPPKFEWYKPEYYVITSDGAITKLNLNRKGFQSQFPMYEKEIMDFIKENDLNPKNEEDLVLVIKKIDELSESVK